MKKQTTCIILATVTIIAFFYFRNKTCVQSKFVTKWEIHHGYNMNTGKYEVHYGPNNNIECITAADTVTYK